VSLGRRLHLLAFLSGAAALAYEVSWTKWLSLTFGSSTLAASATVAAFMGGMGVGAWAYHRIQSRLSSWSALRLYAALELGIAVSAVALTSLLEQLPPLFALLLRALSEPSGGVAVLARVFGALAILLVPTALMGATYPALCSAAISSRDSLDRHLGALYGWNTVGAAFGGLLAGIALIPALGLNAAVAVGVALNLAVGLAALALDRSSEARATTWRETDEPIATSLPRALTGAVLFLSGVATLAYEIVWFRAYRSIAGNSTYAFTIVLVTFLLGLGFGALALRRIVARGRPEASLAAVQLGIALAAAFGIASLAELLATPFGMALSVGDQSVRTMAWQARLALHGGTALALMLPATLLMGLSFPLASRLYLGDVRRVGQRVGGAVLLANTGSIVGSIGAATLLLPRLGSMDSTRLLIGLNAALAVAIACYAPGGLRPLARWLAPGVVAVALLAALVPGVLPHPWNELAGIDARVVFEEEGELSTVRVSEATADPALRGMSIDGTTIGVSAGWHFPIYSKQILLAHLPLWLEPRTRSVLQIGLGSASTLDALTQHPRLERIEAVEISPSVLRAVHLFEESRALSDPRVRVHVEDAIHHLLRSRARYDLIVSDGKQNADFSGNAKMMSRELYALALDRLSPHGLFVQWIAVTNEPEDFAVIARTAGAVFPHLHVFYELPRSAIFVGSREPLEGRARMERADVPPRVQQSLRALGIEQADWLRLGWMADRDALLQVMGEGPLNHWSDPVIEFSAYRAAGSSDRERPPGALNLERLLEARRLAAGRAPAGVLLRDPAARRAHELMLRAYVELLGGDRPGALARIDEAVALAADDPRVLRARRRIAPGR
jgi:spermidine synthase